MNCESPWVEICGFLLGDSNLTTFIDLNTVKGDYRARFGYGLSANQWSWTVCTRSGSAVQLTLQSSSLHVGGTRKSASDNRWKFNEQHLANELYVINKREPFGNDQSHDLLDQYTTDTPKSHQCRFKDQSAQSIDELQHKVIGGQV